MLQTVTTTSRQITSFPKATGIVEISEPMGELTLQDRRLYNHLLAAAYHDLGRAETHTVKLSEIRRFAAEAREGVEDSGNRRLKSSITRLQQTVVQFNYLDNDRGQVWSSAQLLGTTEVYEATGTVVYSFPRGLADRLREPALYSYISLRVMYQFESKYSLILYEILKRYADRVAIEPWWPVKVSELRDLLGCRDKLPDWKDLRRRALDPAVREINELAEFQVAIDEIRQGRGRGGGQVVGVTFRIRKKEREEAEAAVREIDKPRIQRRGERKTVEDDSEFARNTERALRFLTGADVSTRLRWVKKAEELGVQVPKGGMAVENLPKWVPSIAALIVETERT
jgi:plasmid replication initiation protein